MSKEQLREPDSSKHRPYGTLPMDNRTVLSSDGGSMDFSYLHG